MAIETLPRVSSQSVGDILCAYHLLIMCPLYSFHEICAVGWVACNPILQICEWLYPRPLVDVYIYICMHFSQGICSSPIELHVRSSIAKAGCLFNFQKRTLCARAFCTVFLAVFCNVFLLQCFHIIKGPQ